MFIHAACKDERPAGCPVLAAVHLTGLLEYDRQGLNVIVLYRQIREPKEMFHPENQVRLIGQLVKFCRSPPCR